MKKSETKAILFDNDGVLVDTERLYYQANLEMFRKVGFELTPEVYQQFYLRQNCGAWHLIEKAGTDPAVFPAMREARNVRYSELLSTEEILIPGVFGTVSALSESYTIGVVTSSRRDHFNIIHQRTGLLPYFKFVVAEGDYTDSKPNPEPYLAGIKRSGVSADFCLAVEDTERGLAAASAAGLQCWIIPSTLTSKQNFSTAAAVLGSIEDILLRLK